MDKIRAMPILASAAMALSLAACQGMGWGDSGSQAQTSSAPGASASQQQAASTGLVRDVQRSLGVRGYDPGAADGVYGSGTENALRRFQRDQNISSSGQIDTQTLAALGLTGQAIGQPQHAGAAPSPYRPTGQRQGAMAQPSEQTRQVQQSLADRGYDTGPVDGRNGPRTRDALRNFQRDQNISASGRADGQTLAALGIGSGSPGTQTGQMPQQQGELPPTGSQAPGSAPEAGRTPSLPGQEVQPPASPAGQ